ncbi:MAG: cytochrome-c peroxidase [Myxococcota bacterium]
MDCHRASYDAAGLALALLGVLGLSACAECRGEDEEAQPEEGAETEAAEEADLADEPIEPLPEEAEFDEAKMKLGRRLFFDPILSGDGTVACVTCHDLDKGGADGRKTSEGIRSQLGPINSPTVLNSALNVAQFWDGRAADLVEQAKGPVANALEMGATWEEVVARVENEPHYAERFDDIYDDGVTENNVADAIAEYEKALVTPAPFDDYLRGDQDAIDEEAKEGYALFKEVGCTTCHLGQGVGGTSFQKMGLVNDYFEARGGEITEADLGRYNVTKKEEDKHKFKVPLLRNVEKTAPYFHDGSQETLAEAIRAMGHFQLGRDLTDEQVAKIQAFLESLTGEIPEYADLPEDQAIPDRSEQFGEEDDSGEDVAHPRH